MINRFSLNYLWLFLWNYFVSIMNSFIMLILKLTCSPERISMALSIQQLEYKPCRYCGWHFLFSTKHPTTWTSTDVCHFCAKHSIYYKCLSCDRKMDFDDRRKDIKIIEGMFCEYCLPNAPKDVVEQNQGFIVFKRVNAVASPEEYDRIHAKHKEDYDKRMQGIDPDADNHGITAEPSNEVPQQKNEDK